jgi:hypothetical protein
MSSYNTIGRLLFGKNFIPRPGNQESVMDAMEKNHRTVDMENSILKRIKDIPLGDPFKATTDIHSAVHDPMFMRTFNRTMGTGAEADMSLDRLSDNLTKRAVERLKGGLGDNRSDSSFNKKELLEGTRHEREHTKFKSIAKEIAKDHLTERKDYYTALDKAGLE